MTERLQAILGTRSDQLHALDEWLRQRDGTISVGVGRRVNGVVRCTVFAHGRTWETAMLSAGGFAATWRAILATIMQCEDWEGEQRRAQSYDETAGT